MAMKFSATGIFVSDVKKIANAPEKYSLKDDETLRLNEILAELNDLHYTETYHPDTTFIGPNVELNITTEFVVNSRDPQRSGELFGQIHEVLGSHFIETSVYRRLGEAFKELGVEEMINPDLKVAISEAERIRAGQEMGLPRYQYPDQFNPNAHVRLVREREARGGRREFESDESYNDYE